MAFDGTKFGQDVVAATKAYVARELKPLQSRISQLEREVIALRKELRDGADWERKSGERSARVVKLIG